MERECSEGHNGENEGAELCWGGEVKGGMSMGEEVLRELMEVLR